MDEIFLSMGQVDWMGNGMKNTGDVLMGFHGVLMGFNGVSMGFNNVFLWVVFHAIPLLLSVSSGFSVSRFSLCGTADWEAMVFI